MAIPEKELEDRLREVGSRLGSPPTAVDELLLLLDKVESFLSRVEQSPSQSMLNALQPTMNALVAKELLGYSDTDVKVALASCISEVTRITAPDAPYDDDSMKELFLRIVESFEKLDDMSSTSYGKRVSILETVAKVRSCVVMLDLECDDLILDMFRHFLKTISLNHPENVFSSMETIMTLVIEESEDISPNLVSCLLDSVEKGNKLSSLRLAEKVICNCAVKLKPTLMERLQDVPLSKYSKIVYSLCHENSDALEHNDEDASANDMADDSKLSERTVSDELPQGSAKLQQEVGCSEEVSTVKSKSSGVMMSNGTTPLGSGEYLAKTTTTKQKCESSQGGQSESTVLGNAEEPDNLEPAAVKLDSDLNGKKIRGCKTNCSSQLIEATDCYRVNSDEETTIVPGRKKGPKKEADSAQFLGPSAKDVDSSLSLNCTKRDELQPPLTADSGTRQVESLPDSARPKGGRHHGSKVSAKRGRGDMATNEVLPHSELKRVVGDNETQDHVLPSESLDCKELQGISDSEGKSLTGLARNGQPNSASVHETPDIVTGNSELKSRGLAAKTGSTRNVSEGESSQKQKSNFKQKGKANSEENKTGEPNLKKMISPMACSKVLGKIEGKSGENGGSKRKRGDGNKVSASKESTDLDESLVGSKIKVWWPDDKRFYNGVVSSFNPASKKHKILYNDGDVEVLLLSKERWEFVGGDTESDGQGQAKDLPSPVVTPEMLLSGKPKACVGRPQKLAKVETPKSGEESNSVRGQDLPKCRGRPKGGGSKIVMSTEDDSSKSTSKSMEKAVNKDKLKLEKEGTANTGGKLKMDASSQSKGDTDTDGPISKDDGSKNDANSSDGVAKAGRKSRNHTLNHTSKSKDEVSSSEKNRKDNTKSLSTEHTPSVHQKSKDINTAKTGEGPKTDDSALERKLRESEASAAKKRKRKSQR